MKLKTIFIAAGLLLGLGGAQAKKVKVIAHRGYWNTEHSACNSISSLRNAMAIGAFGTEFDVQLTADTIPVVHHDPKTVNGLTICEITFARLRAEAPKLANGELIPTLEDYLTAWNHGKIKLILEIKPHPTPEQESLAVEAVLRLLARYGVKEKQVEFISFSDHICREVLRLRPTATVLPLTAGRTPAQAREEGMKGIDYHYSFLQKHPEWVAQASKSGMTVNVWTVNTEELMREMIELGVDYITTDEPVLLQRVLKTRRK